MIEFKSQICTSVEQSKRLLYLGLKPETADMVYTDANLPYIKDEFRLICKEYLQLHKEVNYEISPFTFIPAWSLHRLMEILDSPLIEFNTLSYNPYEEIIDLISECLKLKLITNKEYLKQ